MYVVSSETFSGSYWLLHNALPSPLHLSKHARKRERDRDREREREREDMTLKVQSINKHIFMKGKQNISSLHKTICGLVSLFL